MIHLTPEQIDARRVERAQIDEQLRILARRKAVLTREILLGYATPAKGVAPEQLSLDTSTATTTAKAPPEAPAQGKEAAKPATATTPATDRDVKPGKPLDATLFKPSKHPEHLLPTLTSKGKRAVLDLLKSAPGGRMPLREITARLGLPDALPFPSECYYQSGDWVLKETPKASKKLAPSKPAPKVKPAAKKAARAPKKAKAEGKPLMALGDRIDLALRAWGSWYDEGQLQAAIREGEPLGQQHSDRDWRGVLKDMLRSKRIERREVDGRVQFRTAPLPKVKKPAVEAPRPTVTVGEAVSKLLAETPPQRWQKVRSLVADRLAGNRGYPIHVADLYLSVDHGSEIDAVMELLEEAGAIHRSLSTVGHKRMIETGAAVDEAVAEDGETSIQAQILALTHAYMLELVAAHPSHPTTDDLARALDLPRGLVLSVLDELRESGALTRGNGGRWQATAQARTLPLIPGVDPAPASEEPCPT